MQSWTKRKRRYKCVKIDCTRYYGTERELSSQLREELAREHVKDLSKHHKAKKDARAIDKVCCAQDIMSNLLTSRRIFSTLF